MERRQSSPSRMLDVGEEAPGFSLMDQSDNAIALDEFRGKKNVVLVFYPGDNTPGCTKQLCAVRDEHDLFNDKNTVVFGINPQNAASHRKFVNRHNFPFPLLVDREKKVVSAYGCKGALATKRTVYSINKEGIIVFARRGMPSNKEILRGFKE